MNKSNSIKNIAVALTKAQSEIKSVKMDAVNPFFKSKYATLGAVIDVSKKVLEDNGLVVTQLSTSNENRVGVTTMLMHDSGEWIDSTCTVAIEGKNIAQEAGKAITYLRRYSLSSLLNLYAEEDNDANTPKRAEKATEGKSTAKKAKPEQIGKSGWTSEQITAVAEAHTDKHGKQIVSTMNMSSKLSRETAIPVLLKWFRVYQSGRDNKVDSQEAAAIADNKVFG